MGTTDEYSARDEHRAVLFGIDNEGFVLTDRHLFAWRGAGTSPAIQVEEIDRVMLDGSLDEHGLSLLVVATRSPGHPPLTLRVEPGKLILAETFIETLAATVCEQTGHRRFQLDRIAIGDVRVMRLRRVA